MSDNWLPGYCLGLAIGMVVGGIGDESVVKEIQQYGLDEYNIVRTVPNDRLYVQDGTKYISVDTFAKRLDTGEEFVKRIESELEAIVEE